MQTKGLWGKIKKSVTDGVTVASEKTEEYAKLGKTKLDVLNTKRKITKKHGEMGCAIYTMLKEGKAGDAILQTKEVQDMVDTLKSLDIELAEKEKLYEDLKKKTDANIAGIKSKTKAGIEDLRSKAKDFQNKAKPVIKKMKEKTEFRGKNIKKENDSEAEDK